MNKSSLEQTANLVHSCNRFMNHEQGIVVNYESEILMMALSNLPQQIGAEQVVESAAEGSHADAVLVLKTGSQSQRFEVEIKKVHRKESLSKLAATARISGTESHRLLVCNPLSDFLADYCEAQRINFIDAAGNARIHTPNLTLWISGKQLPKTDSPLASYAGERMTVGTMKLLFVLLTLQEAHQYTFRELSHLAGISLGMVSKGISFLKQEGFVRDANKQRRLMNEEMLLSQWVRDYRGVLRPKLNGIRLTAPTDWRAVSLADGEVWGGEVAAEQLTQYLKPELLQLFTQTPLQQRIGQLKLRPTNAGKLWLVPAFWGEHLPINTKAKALLAVAELLASGDSRNREAAEIINEHYLHLKELPTSRV